MRVKKPQRRQCGIAAKRSIGPIAVALFYLSFGATHAHAAELDIDPFPGADLERTSSHPSLRAHQFITGPVDKIRRDVRIEKSVRVAGDLERRTYRIPSHERPDEIFEYYQSEIAARGGTIVFDCRGADCGRSTVWANDVLGIPVLAAPINSQFYLAARVPGDATRLLAVYVVQRGNRRIYAHVEWLATDADITFDANRDLSDELARRGWTIVEGVNPDRRSGTLDSDALAELDRVAATLRSFAREDLVVVCHLGGSPDVAGLIERSTRCATSAAERLTEAGLKATPFGAGPLMPRPDRANERVEIVRPYRDRP